MGITFAYQLLQDEAEQSAKTFGTKYITAKLEQEHLFDDTGEHPGVGIIFSGGQPGLPRRGHGRGGGGGV
jgi:hypothetical protein